MNSLNFMGDTVNMNESKGQSEPDQDAYDPGLQQKCLFCDNQTQINPSLFDCLHYACDNCINSLQLTFQSDRQGYNCLICAHFTRRDDISKIPQFWEIKRFCSLKSQGIFACDRCGDHQSFARCHQCKEICCEPCAQEHNRFDVLRTHSWMHIEPAIDRHVFCETHPTMFTQAHCRQCDKLVCPLCLPTHRNHVIEEFSRYPDLTQLRTYAEQLKHVTKQLQTSEVRLDKAMSTEDSVEKDYENMERRIDKKYLAAKKALKENHRQLKERVAEEKKKQLEAIAGDVINLANMVEYQKSVATWGKDVMESTRGAYQMKTIQSGLLRSVKTCATSKLPVVTYESEPTITFNASERLNENLVGEIKPRDSPMYSRFINQPLDDVTELKTQSINRLNITQITRFTKIAERLWCIENSYGQVIIRALNGQVIQTLNLLPQTGTCRSVAESPVNVLIASDNGLFSIESNGRDLKKIIDGNFSDVTVAGYTVYALEYTNGILVILNYSEKAKSYGVKTKIKLECYNAHFHNTIQVTSRFVYIALYADHQILKNQLSGEQLSVISGRGSGEEKLTNPHLCGTDENGVVLIADESNDRLQMLTPEDHMMTVQIPGLGSNPLCVHMSDNRLLVAYNRRIRGEQATFEEFLLQQD